MWRDADMYLHLTGPTEVRIMSGVCEWDGMSSLASERALGMERKVASLRDPVNRTASGSCGAGGRGYITREKRFV
jgi:hypothetical protein